MDYKSRLKTLRKAIKEQNLDGIIITDPVNRRYISGFTGSFGTLFIDSRSAYIATDSRYFIQTKNESPDFTLLQVGDKSASELFMDRKKLKGKKIGFEADVLSVSEYDNLKKKMSGVKLTPTERIVKNIRAIKSSDEIKLMQRAQSITDACFEMLMNKVKPGMTEEKVAWMIEKFQREAGAESNSFSSIVASGPNSALPHAVPTNKKIKKNEPLLFDFGCRVDGYNSDMTRVIFFGKPSGKMEYIYNRVLKTHLMVYEMASVGAKVADIDNISRDYIYKSKLNKKSLMGEGKGKGRYEHGLGHGVGLEVHELPVLSKKMIEDVLNAGHVVTNEPGLYIEGEGGVRIEDMMLITRDGPESFTSAPKELIVL